MGETGVRRYETRVINEQGDATSELISGVSIENVKVGTSVALNIERINSKDVQGYNYNDVVVSYIAIE